VKTIIAVLTILGFAFGAYFFVDNKYACSEDVKKLEKRLDYKIISDQALSIQQRIWTITDRFEGKKMDKTTKEEFQQLEKNKEDLNNKLKSLESSK
jgi:hypothetical protein